MSSVNEKIMKIMSLVLKIDDMGEVPHIMTLFASHASLFEIRIYRNGWKEKTEPDYSKEIFFCFEDEAKKFDEVIEVLEKILKEV